MSIKEDRLRDALGKVAVMCGIKNWRVKAEETRKTIETYFGVLIPLTVIGDYEGKETFRHVFVKLPSTDESLKEYNNIMWDVEVYVYANFVPVWKRASNVNIDELIPQCYYADATPYNQILVLKNMKCDGFQNYEESFLDFEHVVVSLKTLAQFHALSFIITKDHEQLAESLLRPYTEVYAPQLVAAIVNTFRTHSQLFKGSKYESFWQDTLLNYKKVANSTFEAKFLLYGHGDLWKDNIMFKYENNKPVKACLFDFQTCRLMTPAFDFLYFILNSTDGSLRRFHYHHFVTKYYETFRNTLLDHGVQLELLYTSEDFISDLKIVTAYCFMRMCLAFSLWLGFESNGLVKSKNSLENSQQRDKEERHFKGRLIDAMEDLFSYGYITL